MSPVSLVTSNEQRPYARSPGSTLPGSKITRNGAIDEASHTVDHPVSLNRSFCNEF
jgi:hypothetical protein